MANTIDRSNPGALAAGTGGTFRTNLNADRDTVYDHAVALESEVEILASEYMGDGTLPSNTAVCSIDSPVAGRVYCPVGYKAVVGGVPVETSEIISQAYIAATLTHVFLVVGTSGALTLRCSASATIADNELWIADVTAVPAIDNTPAGKIYASIPLGDGTDGSLWGRLDARFQVIADTGAANSEMTIAHGLGRTPIGYIVVRRSDMGIVYDGTTPWTSTNIYLKCNATNAAITILVF